MSEKHTLLGESNPKDIKNLVTGLAGAVGYIVACVGGIVCIQLMKQIPPDFQLNSLRFAMGLIFALVYLSIKRKSPVVRKENLKWLSLIAVLTVLFNILIYSHFLKSITFVGKQSLHRSYGVVFSLILSKLFLKVKVSLAKGLIATAILCGLCLTLSAQFMEPSSRFNKCTKIGIENISASLTEHSMERTHYMNVSIEIDKSNNRTTTSEAVYNKIEPCFSTTTTLIGVIIISFGAFCGCLESIIIAGTGLKEENPASLSLWNFIVGLILSLTITFTFEHPITPDNVTDIILYFGHAVSASSVTYFDLLAVQNIDVSLYYVTVSLSLPLSFLLQCTILQSVTPDANIWLLVSGMVVIFLCALILPMYEYFLLKRKQ